MNFLAHLHLSYPNKAQMVGNFIGDYVKGKRYNDYESTIREGILLHRAIDSFTDDHLLHKSSRGFFRKEYGLYSGVVVDMLFDHFLANNWHQYSDLSLTEFSKTAYDTLYEYHTILPTRVQDFLPKMKANQRLESYASLEGIEDALSLMAHYTSLPNYSKEAIQSIVTHYDTLENNFLLFYKELMTFVKEQ